VSEERVAEEPEVQIPFFYERFQEERDKRFASEIARLEGEIRRNGQRLDELKADNATQHEELRAAIARLDGKIDRVRDELKGEIISLRREMQSTFRWMIGLLLPVILGVVALLIQNLLKP